MEDGIAFSDTSAYADVLGNAFAVANSEQTLWLEACCRAYAEAQALACSFMRVDGDIKVDTTNSNGYKDVGMKMNLKTATLTIALANSLADVEAYTGVGTQSFTSVAAYCAAVKNKSILCGGGTASSDLTTFATGTSQAFGTAGALAQSGSNTQSYLQVSGRGSSLDYLNGVIGAYATSWSFANAGALVSAMATTYAETADHSFSVFCIAEHEKICAIPSNQGHGICSEDATAACAKAASCGEAFGWALAQGCAEAYAVAVSGTQVNVAVSANIACKGTPSLTWQCAGAYAETVCPL